MLFESISNSPWFIRTALILFLNKMDLFKAKLEISPIPKYFSEYIGDHTNLKTATTFFRDKLENLNRNSHQVCLFFVLLHVPRIMANYSRRFTRISLTQQIKICWRSLWPLSRIWSFRGTWRACTFKQQIIFSKTGMNLRSLFSSSPHEVSTPVTFESIWWT